MNLSNLLLETPIGKMGAVSSKKGIRSLKFLTLEEELVFSKKSDCLHLNKLKEELENYLEGKTKEFMVSVDIEGTDFQKKVWEELRLIPYGKTISYQELAQKINSPNAVRAVGGANNKNKLLVIIPCHRVIGKNGKLVGYGGGIDKKKWLLNHESQNKKF